jgi:hypothetical protein
MKKYFVALAIYSSLIFCVASAQEPTPVPEVVVTGIVKLDEAYKARVKKNKKNPKSEIKLAKDCAILNGVICFEGVEYTISKTGKITERTKHDRKEFEGGAFEGGAYIKVVSVERGVVNLKYRNNDFTDVVLFKKRLKKPSK